MAFFGEAALQPVCELIVAGGGKFSTEVELSFKWREGILPSIAPSLIMGSMPPDAPGPARASSDAMGAAP